MLSIRLRFSSVFWLYNYLPKKMTAKKTDISTLDLWNTHMFFAANTFSRNTVYFLILVDGVSVKLQFTCPGETQVICCPPPPPTLVQGWKWLLTRNPRIQDYLLCLVHTRNNVIVPTPCQKVVHQLSVFSLLFITDIQQNSRIIWVFEQLSGPAQASICLISFYLEASNFTSWTHVIWLMCVHLQ